MLRGILGFLPFVLSFASVLLGLALDCLSLVFGLLAETHEWLLCVLQYQVLIRAAFPAELPETRRSEGFRFHPG